MTNRFLPHRVSTSTFSCMEAWGPNPQYGNFRSVCASRYLPQRNNPGRPSVAEIGNASAELQDGISGFQLLQESLNTESVGRTKFGEIADFRIEESFNTDSVGRTKFGEIPDFRIEESFNTESVGGTKFGEIPDFVIEESINADSEGRKKFGEITDFEAGLMEGVSEEDLFFELPSRVSYAPRQRFGEISDAEAGFLEDVSETDMLSERVPDIAPASALTGSKLVLGAQARQSSGRAASCPAFAQPNQSSREHGSAKHGSAKHFKSCCKQAEPTRFSWPATRWAGSLLTGSDSGSPKNPTFGRLKKLWKPGTAVEEFHGEVVVSGGCSTRQRMQFGSEPTSWNVEFTHSQKASLQQRFEHLDHVPMGESVPSPELLKTTTCAWSPTFEKDTDALPSSCIHNLSKKHQPAKYSTSSSSSSDPWQEESFMGLPCQ